MFRDETKKVMIGNVCIGGGSPVAIQSMTNTKTEDVEATVTQILALEKAGCEIIRCAVPTMEAALAWMGKGKKVTERRVENLRSVGVKKEGENVNSEHFG